MIVFDASTLILIAKVELLDSFLSSVTVPVVIPSEVERECCSYKKTLDVVVIQRALNESRIEVATIRNRRMVDKLEADFNLGMGEAEAIALALDRRAQLLAIDDKNGINACKLLGLAFTTAVAILVRAKEKRLLEEAEALEKLSLLAKYGRYKTVILEDARHRLKGEP